MKSVLLIKEKAAIEFDMQITTRQKTLGQIIKISLKCLRNRGTGKIIKGSYRT